MAIILKSDDSRVELAQFVLNSWTEMRTERRVLEEKWKRCMMAVLGEHDAKWVKWAKQANRSRRFVELSGDAVDTIAPQVYDAAFGPLEWMKMQPLRTGYKPDDDKQAEAMKYLLKFQMGRTAYAQTAKIAIKQLITLGNCPWGMDWYTRKAVNNESNNEEMARWLEESAAWHQEFDQIKEEHEKVSQAIRLSGGEPPPMPEFEEPPMPPRNMDIVYEGPRLWIASIFNYVQEQHPNDGSKALRILRSWRTKEYLKEAAKPKTDGYRLYSNLENIGDISSEATTGDNEAEALIKMALGMQMPFGKSKVEIKQMHGDFEILKGGEKGVYKDYIVTVANKTLIGCEPSKLYSGAMMVRNAKLGLIEGAVYGRGPIEKGLNEQDSTNALHNQVIDAANTVIAPENEVVEEGLVHGVKKPSGPGVDHRVYEKGTITPIAKNFQGLPMGAQVVDSSIARHERFVGAINTSTGSSETATRTSRNSSVIATKLGSHVMDFEEDFVTPSLDMMLEMNAQYIDEEQIVNITQDDTVVGSIKVPASWIRRGWTAKAGGSKYLAEQQERIQNLMMAAQITEQQEATGQVSPIRKVKLYRLLFKEVLGEADDLVMSEEAFQAEKLAKMKYDEQQQVKQVRMEAAAKGGQSGNQQAGANNTNGGEKSGSS